MPGASRLGDKSYCPSDGHGCPGCAHPVQGPATAGSPNVHINMKPALRTGDPGVHSSCCGPNTWTATKGSSTVIINGQQAMRLGDVCTHCGGMGKMIEASSNVFIGDNPGSMSPGPAVTMIAAAARSIAERITEFNDSPSSYRESNSADSSSSSSTGANSGAGSSQGNNGTSVATSRSANDGDKNQSAFGDQDAEHLAPQPEETQNLAQVSGLKWNKPRLPIAESKEFSFNYQGFNPGDTVEVKIYRFDGNENKLLLDSVPVKLTSSEGTLNHTWDRSVGEIEADVEENQDQDGAPLGYRFEIEQNGEVQESGTLNLTQDLELTPKTKNGQPIPDGYNIIVELADGTTLKQAIQNGRVEFKNVLVGPSKIGLEKA